jgi:hypothetical protein
MFDFERVHQMARDARAKGQRKVLLPHDEFRDAMQTFYSVTKGKRACSAYSCALRFISSKMLAIGLPPLRVQP